MVREGRAIVSRYYLALIGTVLLWGSSFPGIKIVMSITDPFTYTWLRGLFSILMLLPLIIYLGWGSRRCIVGGFTAGIFYSLGLFFQGWGTAYTTASNSAFITGLNAPFVHLFRALYTEKYSWRLGLSLVLGLTGLYLLTAPRGRVGIGDLLVLVGSVMWALQILAVDKYTDCNPITLVFYMFLPTLTFTPPTPIRAVLREPMVIPILLYLAGFCSIGAFALQVYGQRGVKPEAAAIIFLLEPVVAAVLSNLLLSETLSLGQVGGASLILLSMYFASKGE